MLPHLPQVRYMQYTLLASPRLHAHMQKSSHRFKCEQATSVWRELTGLKRIICEPRGAGEGFDAAMKDYYGAIETGRGAIFFAIFRGKVRQPYHMQHNSDKETCNLLNLVSVCPILGECQVRMAKPCNACSGSQMSSPLI